MHPLADLKQKLFNDDRLEYLDEMAYILATIKHETANTYLPIAEYGKGRGHSYGIPDLDTHQTYYGRGYVQLTWKSNYQKFSDLLGVDLVNNPDLVMAPQTAYDIIVVGMLNGLFTGKALKNYISDAKKDYLNARRIINGMDKAALIAGYAIDFEKDLEKDNA